MIRLVAVPCRPASNNLDLTENDVFQHCQEVVIVILLKGAVPDSDVNTQSGQTDHIVPHTAASDAV